MRSEAGEPVTELAVTGWHFLATRNGVPVLRDGRPAPPVGVWLHHDGDLKLCVSGLHVSQRALDALSRAPGPIACRVTCSDVGERVLDEFVCRWRRIDGMCDATDVLHAFARLCALSVAHLWDCPTVMTRFLETGEESLREAAWKAVWAARAEAWAEARVVAWEETWAAARAEARAEAREAARVAVWTGSGATWAAAREGQNAHLEMLLSASMR